MTGRVSPLGGLAGAIVVLVVVNVLANAGMVLTPMDPDGPLVATDLLVVGALVLFFGTLIALAATVLTFLHRARQNVDAFGAVGLKWTPGWAVGGWFIPVANLVIPGMAVAETWKASEPGRSTGGAWRENGAGLVWAWWSLWVLASLSGQVWNRIDAGSAAELPVGIVHVLAHAAAGLLFILVVRQLAARQEACARGPATPAAPGTWGAASPNETP